MKTNILALLVAILSFASHPAHSDIKDRYVKKQLEKFQPKLFRQDIGTTETAIFKQVLDHNSPNSALFDQRYHYNSTFATASNAPTLLYICGEASCDTSEISRGAIVNFARELGAHLVTLEHRYYGKSVPVKSLSTENLRFLSTDYALKDLANFQKFAAKDLGMNGKWIAVGGSYAGSLAAYYRLKYPENVVGALASSAPVLAKAKFEEYDLHVSKVTGPVCGEQIRAVVKQIEKRMETAEGTTAVKELFQASDVINDVDFLYVVADMAAFAVQYGFTERFCSGLDDTHLVESYAKTATDLLGGFGITPVMISFQAAENLDPIDSEEFAMRPWMYQSCTEYGYYQVSYHDAAQTARSSRIDLEYHNEVCKRLFGFETQVDTEKTNKIFYEPLLIPEVHSIYFTNGSTDPWTNLSITPENGNNTNENLDLYTLVGGAHCTDLGNSKSEAAIEARNKFLSLAKAWLAR